MTALANHIQLWGVEGEHLVYTDGSAGIVCEISPRDVSCWDDERLNSFSHRIRQFLNGFPSEVYFQVSQEITRGHESTVSAHESRRAENLDSLVSGLISRRVERLRKLDQDGLLPQHRLKLVLRTKPSKLPQAWNILSSKSAIEKVTAGEIQNEVMKVERFYEYVSKGLEMLEVKCERLPVASVLSEVYAYWNPDRPIEMGSFDPSDVRNALVFTDLAVHQRGFSLGDTHFRVVTLKVLPEMTFSTMISALRDLPFRSQLMLSVYVPDQQKELTLLQTQRRVAFSMARGAKQGVSDIESEAKLNDVEAILEDMVSQGEKVFHIALNVILRANSAEELEAQVGQTLMKIREMSGAEAMEESLAAFDVYCGVVFPHAKAQERTKRVKTSNLADFLPLYGPWQGHAEPRILLRSRSGGLIKFDPFSSALTNANQIISGGSGSGKSYLTNILLLHLLKETPKVFIVDIGGSYKKLCESLGGQYIPLGVNSNQAINPFDLLPGESKPSNEKIKFLVGLIEMMTAEDESSRLNRLLRAEVEELVHLVYDKHTRPRLSHLKELLTLHPDIEIKRLGRILTSWCGDSPYGQFVDRPTNVQLNRNVVSFDLKGMETYPDLQAVCLYMITDLVWRDVQADKSKKKVLVLDECWRLLENGAGSTFIAEVFRTFRKYNAGAIAISQNIDDFARSRVATAILPNSATKWILMQKGADQARLKEVLQLNDAEMDLIASLRQVRGSFSEAFLMSQDDRSVVAIESTPEEYWVATTDPRDLTVLESFAKENPKFSHFEIISELAKTYPNGVAARS